MFSIDDRAGNVLTTVALFSIGAVILYVARGAFFILLLSVLFAYLLEPAVTLVQKHSRLGHKNRSWAIAQVYLIGAVVLGVLAYAVGPHLVAQTKSLKEALPEILAGLSNGSAGAPTNPTHGLSAAQQLRVQNWLAGHRDLVTHVFERAAAAAGYITASAIWLLAVPILAIFILRDGRRIVNGFIEDVERRRGPNLLTRVLPRVDILLAKYIRAQLALAGLSFAFYTVSMLALGFPHAIALGLLGGVLEFLPAVGWIASAAAMLTVGFLTHAHWIWMAGLIIVWRFVQDYVNSPRIMGDNLGLQPLTVLFALMVGGQLGGIAGVYLAVPAVAVLKIVWLEHFSTRHSPAVIPDQTTMGAGK